MTVFQLALIARYTTNINLLLDNDEAGEKGRSRILNKFSKFVNIKNYYIPEPFKDIDDYLNGNSDLSLFE